MAIDIRPLEETGNVSILNAIRTDASLEYQRRIPEVTDATVQDTVRQLMNYRPHFNEFADALVNRIGTVIARNQSWQNPLAQFKRGLLEYGDTVEEIQTGLLQAHVYDHDRESLERDIFGTEIPEVQTSFHRVNRENYYRITVNTNELKRAFLAPQGLSGFVSQVMQAPVTSDNWDEFMLTASLFKTYDANGGFHYVNVPNVTDGASDAADAKVVLRKLRAMAQTITFLSTAYNAAKMPVAAKPDELILFATPEFFAAIDVEALAVVFNIDRAQIPYRTIPIPAEYFGIDGCQAILTTRDFFVIMDQVLENTSQVNPVKMHTNFFLHHWQIVSASRFVPAIMFTTKSGSEVVRVPATPTAIAAPKVYDRTATEVSTVAPGDRYTVNCVVTSDTDGVDFGVVYTVAGNVSAHTYVTNTGVLHVGLDETAATLTVRGQTTWLDPTNPKNDPLTSATTSVTVAGPLGTRWPAEGCLTAITINGVKVANVSDATLTYAVTVPRGTTVTAATVVPTVVGGTVSGKTVTSVSGGYTVKFSVDNGPGDPVEYTVAVTVAAA